MAHPPPNETAAAPGASTAVSINIGEGADVSGLIDAPLRPWAGLVLAHGAGAGMAHASMAALALGLCARGIATLRYQFPYMERGSRRPDPPPLCHATVRAAAAFAQARWPALPLYAGGRSFGGRMTSQAQALERLPGVRGLVFFAFPLHPAHQEGATRARHLFAIDVPMLFVQGSRDALAAPALMGALIAQLGKRARLYAIEAADHAFHVPARTGRSDERAREEMLDAVAAWLAA